MLGLKLTHASKMGPWWKAVQLSEKDEFMDKHVQFLELDMLVHELALLNIGDHSGDGLNQWKMMSHCNVVFHWLGPYPECSLNMSWTTRFYQAGWRFCEPN